jgi:hypothetical protein
LARALLAALLAFASEILVWVNPPARSLLDWALLVPGYLALSALLLEIAARYRLRDAYGLLMLAGVYGMLNGLILNPASALVDVPRTLITRAMGAHGLSGLVALALFFGLAGGLRARRALVAALVLAVIVGAGWGTWAHWSPVEFSGLPPSAPESLLICGGIGIALAAAVWAATRRVPPRNLRLSPRGWALTLLALGGLLLLHLLRGEIDPLSLVVIVTLSAFSVIIIWFQMRKKGTTLLDSLADTPASWGAFGLLVAGFGLAAAVGYSLPRVETSAAADPLALIGALFTAYGLIWLPAVSIVLGARAFARQARAMRL